MSEHSVADSIPTPEYLQKLLVCFSEVQDVSNDDIISLGDIPLVTGDRIEASEVRNSLSFLAGGGSVGMLRDHSIDEIEAIYSLARSYLNNGEYDSGHTLCQYLCINDHLNTRNWLALGMSQTMQGRFDHALNSYSFGSMIGNNEPEFPIKCAEIHLIRGDFDAAKAGAELGIKYLRMSSSVNSNLMKLAKALLDSVNRRQCESKQSGKMP